MTGVGGRHRLPRGTGPTRAAAVLLLGVVCFGVPVCLLALTGLPFSHVDPLLPLREASGTSATDVRAVADWLGQVVLVIAWVAWAWTAICIVLEARSWRSGRSPVRLPGSRTMQWVVAVLVGTAFTIGGVGRAAHPLQQVGPSAVRSVGGVQAVPGFERRLAVRTVEEASPDRAPGGPSGGLMGERPDAPRVDGDEPGGAGHHGSAPMDGASVPIRHNVSARETLWSIAELRLGTPRRWREIAELNYGRPQGDGGRLADDHWIHPGWTLDLPPSAQLLPRAPEGAGAALDRAGAAVPPSAPASPPTQAPTPTPTQAPVVPIGAGVVGVGVTDLLDRLRRVQQRHRLPGGRIRLPDPVLARFEQRLRGGDGADRMRSAEDAVVRYFTSCPGNLFPAPVLGVVVSGESVELVIDDAGRSDDPPPGFTRESGASIIRIGRTSLRTPFRAPLGTTRERPGRTGRRAVPLPTLVAIGRSDDRLVLLNLEVIGSLAIDGEDHDAEGVVRALALELATSRWAGQFDLVLVGFGAELERFERVTVTGAAGPLLADLSWRRLRDAMVLGDRGFASVTEARWRDGGTSWAPVVVICGPGVPSEDAAALVTGCGTGTDGIAVIAVSGDAGDLGASRAIRATPAGAAPVTEVFGSLLDPQQVSAGEVDQVVRLVAVAEQVSGVTTGEGSDAGDVGGPAVLPADGVSDPGPGPGPGAGPNGHPRGPVAALVVRPTASAAPVRAGSGQPDANLRPPGAGSSTLADDGASTPTDDTGCPHPEVEVAVLGPVEIRGAARAFTRAWATELVVYLAMHPSGASNDRWSTALWPDRVMAPSSLHSTASVARRSLGKARDGSDHLPRSHGRLALGPSVGTDWDRFVALSERGHPAEWRAAMELVRGRPFEGLRSTDWAVLDGTAPSMESVIVDLSGRLAGACLRAGDPRGAEWSARRGLLVSPYDERLYRMLLRAADAAGNPGGVESVMTELVRVVADEIEPVESVHPSTLALYRSLSRRRVPTM